MGIRAMQQAFDGPGIWPPGHREQRAVGPVEQIEQVAEGRQLDVLHLVNEQFAQHVDVIGQGQRQRPERMPRRPAPVMARCRRAHRDHGTQARGDDAGIAGEFSRRAAGGRGHQRRRQAAQSRCDSRPADAQAWQSRKGSRSSTVIDMSCGGDTADRLPCARRVPGAELRDGEICTTRRPARAAAPRQGRRSPAGESPRRGPAGSARSRPRPAAPPPRPVRPGARDPDRDRRSPGSRHCTAHARTYGYVRTSRTALGSLGVQLG